MNCEIIQDLIPLYADGCCSQASRELVEEHIGGCDACRAALTGAQTPMEQIPVQHPGRIRKISLWSGSILQSALFLLLFAVITFGVYKEAGTAYDEGNGTWAMWMVVPATGFLLSLVNWYFVRLYKNRRTFVLCSVLAAAVATLACQLWCVWHYYETVDMKFCLWLLWVVLHTVLWLIPVGCLVLSGVLAWVYARMIGKE